MSNKCLCTTINKTVDYDYCANKCLYAFNNECKNLINIGYQQGRADAINEVIKFVEGDYEYINYFFEIPTMTFIKYLTDLKEQTNDGNNN